MNHRPPVVVPTKVGTHPCQRVVRVGPGFRRDDMAFFAHNPLNPAAPGLTKDSMNRRRLLLTSLALSAAALAACSDKPAEPAAAAPAAAAPAAAKLAAN